MSEFRRGRGLAPEALLLIGALFFPVGRVDAQARGDRAVGSGGDPTVAPAGDSAIAAARAEVDRLIPALRLLSERASSAEERERMRRLREERLPVDTFQVGPFHVAARPEQRELAEQMIRDAWTDLRPLVDGSEDLVAPWTFLIHYAWSRETNSAALLRQMPLQIRQYIRR
jgi:hypothetical protein